MRRLQGMYRMNIKATWIILSYNSAWLCQQSQGRGAGDLEQNFQKATCSTAVKVLQPNFFYRPRVVAPINVGGGSFTTKVFEKLNFTLYAMASSYIPIIWKRLAVECNRLKFGPRENWHNIPVYGVSLTVYCSMSFWGYPMQLRFFRKYDLQNVLFQNRWNICVMLPYLPMLSTGASRSMDILFLF